MKSCDKRAASSDWKQNLLFFRKHGTSALEQAEMTVFVQKGSPRRMDFLENPTSLILFWFCYFWGAACFSLVGCWWWLFLKMLSLFRWSSVNRFGSLCWASQAYRKTISSEGEGPLNVSIFTGLALDIAIPACMLYEQFYLANPFLWFRHSAALGAHVVS